MRRTPHPGRRSAASSAFALGLAAALAGCAEPPLAPEPAFSRAPERITFAKQFKDGESNETLFVWHGTVEAGGLTGNLVSTIDLTAPGTMWRGQTLHATVRWVATGDVAFEIVTTGIINLANGIVRTNGRGISGLGAGAQVHQQGQLTGMDAAGFLRFNPATAP